MAGTPIAYSEITILDLIDTATYIYYSANENGTGATIAPGADTKYIGIYSGPPFEGGQPHTPPNETEWSKYVGDKGDKGEKGEKGDSALLVESNVSELYFFHSLNSQESEIREGNVTSLRIELFRIPKNEGNKIELKEENCSFICTNSELSESFSQYYEIINNEQDTADNGTLVFYFQNFLTDKALILDKQSWENPIAFVFSYKENEEIQCVKVFDFRPGVSADMAKFNITATNINAAVNNTKMKFSKDGLSIYGAGFSIYDNTGEDNIEVLSMDNSGKLSLKKIIAESGTIGGFTIDKGVKENKEYDRLVSSNNGIILDGKNNNIIAETIKLGVGAKIQDYLLLGEAKIQNPVDPNGLESSNKRPFIEAKGIKIFDNGNAKFGKISIDGDNSKIYGDSFSITPTEASFDNVTVSGKIRAAIFEQGTTQTVGGMILIRPVSKIVLKEEKYSLENNVGFNDGDLCEFNGNPCKIFIDNGNCTFKTIGGNDLTTLPSDGDILINYGQGINNVGIAINSSDNGAAFQERAITVFEAAGSGSSIEKKSKIVLGYMGEEAKYGGLTGYGLYAENVYLHGALVTELKDDTTYYSGFNGKRPDGLNGPYTLLWAGAPSNDGEYNITKAPFQVDSEGNLYASKGRFNGSVISNATIEAAEIITPIITGNGTEPALKICEVSEGIGFFNSQYTKADISKGFEEEIEYYEKYSKKEDGKEEDKKEYYRLTIDKEPRQDKEYYTRSFAKTLSIKDNGLYFQNKEFITLSTTGEASYFAKEIKFGNTTIINDKISWGNNHGIQYSNNIFEIGQIDASSDTNIGTAIIKMQAKEFMIGPKMRYEPAENGCDLYVL